MKMIIQVYCDIKEMETLEQVAKTAQDIFMVVLYFHHDVRRESNSLERGYEDLDPHTI